MMDLIGLVLIVLAWAIQFAAQGKSIQPAFPILYALGVLLLVIPGAMAGSYLSSGLNLIAVVLAAGVAIKVSR